MVLDGEISDDEIPRDHKAKLLTIAAIDILIDNKKSPLMVGLSRTTNSLSECFEGKRRKIIYPQFSKA
jgi:CRISPR-associated protein Cas1